MSDFFEFPEPEPETERPRRTPQPPWVQPPLGFVAGAVPVQFVLARSDRAAVAVTKLGAYPDGFEFELVVLAADEDEYELDPMINGMHRHPGRPKVDREHDLLRFGIQFADGTRATNLGGHRGWPRSEEPPDHPVLLSRGGSSSGGSEWKQDMWVWPLPPPGPLTFVCEWPAAGIELTRVEVDARLVIDAAAAAEQIFVRTRDPGSASSHSVGVARLKRSPEPPAAG